MVNIIKYFYTGYIVFQFEIHNMLSDQILKEININLQLKDTPLQLVTEVKSDTVGYGQSGYAYNVLTYNSTAAPYPTGTFKAKMSFLVAEVDPITKAEQGSYPDEYPLNDVKLTAKDYIKGKVYSTTDFK